MIHQLRAAAEALDRGDHHVLTLRDSKIIDVQGRRSRREAERYARRS